MHRAAGSSPDDAVGRAARATRDAAHHAFELTRAEESRSPTVWEGIVGRRSSGRSSSGQSRPHLDLLLIATTGDVESRQSRRSSGQRQHEADHWTRVRAGVLRRRLACHLRSMTSRVCRRDAGSASSSIRHHRSDTASRCCALSRLTVPVSVDGLMVCIAHPRRG